MNNFILCILLILLSSNLWASQEFKGFIEGRLEEASGDKYGFVKFGDELSDESLISLDQLSGQTLYLVNKSKVLDGSFKNKYYASILVKKIDDEKFNAFIKLYDSTGTFKNNKKSKKPSKEFKTYSVVGDFNSENLFHFTDQGLPDFFIRMEVDRVFSIEESKERLLKTMRKENKRKLSSIPNF